MARVAILRSQYLTDKPTNGLRSPALRVSPTFIPASNCTSAGVRLPAAIVKDHPKACRLAEILLNEVIGALLKQRYHCEGTPRLFRSQRKWLRSLIAGSRN